MARGRKTMAFVGLAALMGLRQTTFVPAPARGVAPMAAAGGVLATLGAAPAAHADRIDDAAKKLSAASYPFLKEIDWTSGVYAKLPTAAPLDVLKAVDKMIVMGAAMDGNALKAGALAHHKALGSMNSKGVTTLEDYEKINAAIGHMVASAGESKTMDVYNAFDAFSLGKDVGPYMMSKVNADDAKTAYEAFLEFKDTVKAEMKADKIDAAARKLSEASYPFLKEIDWKSDVYAKLPTAAPLDVLKAVDKMIVMGAAMDGSALKAGAIAHHNALGTINSKGVTTLADYTAINAAIGRMVASAGESKTMDVYNAFDAFGLGKDVGPYMMSKVSAEDAKKAYEAFLEFKDVVKASM